MFSSILTFLLLLVVSTSLVSAGFLCYIGNLACTASCFITGQSSGVCDGGNCLCSEQVIRSETPTTTTTTTTETTTTTTTTTTTSVDRNGRLLWMTLKKIPRYQRIGSSTTKNYKYYENYKEPIRMKVPCSMVAYI